MRWLVLMVTLASLAGCSRKTDQALSPGDTLGKFQVHPDFRVELFAAEPDVVSPVEMAFDEFGRVYVAEMLDYPEDPPPGKPVRSRIRLLEDADGDGKFERNVIFADQLLQVSSCLPWNKGLLVASAPDILFLQDTNGDGKADVRRVLYTGFPKVNPEARITNLRYGLDNWVYAANTGSNGRITAPGRQMEPVLVRGADFRFHPTRDLAEAVTGPAQFGLTFDVWGNRFITQNTIHVRHAIVQMPYLARAPALNVPEVVLDISDHGKPSARMFPLTKPQRWREERTKLRQKRYAEQGSDRVEHVGGFFTAASGGTIYSGDTFPKEFWGTLFTGDVSGNLVHRDLIKPAGVTFTASRVDDGKEFIASTDIWFRPCNFANAPDGNLYMMDIYRLFIETPESIPEELRKAMDFYAGDDRGRIYRIVPKQPLRSRSLKPNIGNLRGAELAGQLAEANGWHRTTAQRLIVERQDREAIPTLRTLATGTNAIAKVHALWTLEALDALDADLVRQALKDGTPEVRVHALRLAERFLPAMERDVLPLHTDSDVRVQFQTAFTLGTFRQPPVQALAKIASQHPQDNWFQTAVLSSVANAPLQFLTVAPDPYLGRLAGVIGTRANGPEIQSLLARASQKPEVLEGLASGLRIAQAKQIRIPQGDAVFQRLFESSDARVQQAAWTAARHFELPGLVSRASREVPDAKLPVEVRARAMRALAAAQFDVAVKAFQSVFATASPAPLQVAAVESISTFDAAEADRLLIANWRAYAPDARVKAVSALMMTQRRIEALLAAVEANRIEPGALDATSRARLMATGDRAKRLLQPAADDRMKVVDSYKPALTLTGDVDRGKTLFEENCARCHNPRKQGGRIGPDLSGINNKTKEELLLSILHPSYAIEPRFTNYIVTMKDGRMYDGLIGNETATMITLRGGSEEGDQTLLRSQIQEVRASTVSLMPEDLEKTISHQGAADILAYLRGGL